MEIKRATQGRKTPASRRTRQESIFFHEVGAPGLSLAADTPARADRTRTNDVCPALVLPYGGFNLSVPLMFRGVPVQVLLGRRGATIVLCSACFPRSLPACVAAEVQAAILQDAACQEMTILVATCSYREGTTGQPACARRRKASCSRLHWP